MYLVYRLVFYVIYRFKNKTVMKSAKQFLVNRNNRKFVFKTEGLNVEEIINMGVDQLHEGLINGQFTSVDLVNVFGQRCYTIGRGLCLTTQEGFQTALITAEEKDDERKELLRKGKKLGLLHGIPISVKDFINQKGKLSTFGAAYLCDEFMKEDSAVLKQYLNAGAVPLVKGNVPQLGASQNSSNPIFGEALNPHDNSRVCGGSSGGDAALVAAKCIPFAIGTDQAGSLRVPSSFCGIYTFKAI